MVSLPQSGRSRGLEADTVFSNGQANAGISVSFRSRRDASSGAKPVESSGGWDETRWTGWFLPGLGIVSLPSRLGRARTAIKQAAATAAR